MLMGWLTKERAAAVAAILVALAGFIAVVLEAIKNNIALACR
jgi:cytochrome c-type biogenesis protein CcmE